MKTKAKDILYIEGTSKSPTVFMDPGEGKIEFKGRVIPENYFEFFRPILSYLDENFNHCKTLHVHFHLEYFSSPAGKCILDTLKKFESIYRSGVDLHVFWYYEEDDEDMLQAGQDYDHTIRVPFQLIEITE